MFFRGRLLASRMPRSAVGGVVLGLALVMSASTAQAVPAADADARLPGIAGNPDPVKGKNAKSKPRPVDRTARAAAKTLDPVTWPQPGSVELPLSYASAFTSRQLSASPTAPAAPVVKKRVGGIPVTVAPGAAPRGATAGSAPTKVSVASLGRTAAEKWGSAALLTVRRADDGAAPASVELSLDYASFADGAGGAYGSRLQLLKLPACAVAEAPGTADCKSPPERIPFRNDPATHTITGQVPAAPASAGVGAVFAVAAGDSSSKGDYKATSLAPSASWSVANSSGGFSWDYPLRMIPTPGGLTPTVGLGYSSQSADGRTAATNNQGSWVGEGFSYEPGYIERSYKPCSEDGQKTSAEQCWAFDNATIMLNGMSGELIQDDTTKEWHLTSENGSKIAKLTGTGNGDNDGEYWKLTTTDGTEYYFGLNKLPGWRSDNPATSGTVDPDPTTDSTWSTPVFGNSAGEPCYNATFANAHCKQAWRWNLDYVKDTHGNVMSYFYGAEKNNYALNAKTDVNGTEYDRGGYLKRIDYGQRDGAVYTAKAPARVVFNTAERCLADASFDCAESKFTVANAARWPDTPVDRYCKAGTKCTVGQSSQTFWTTKRLTGVTTQMSTGSGASDYNDVEAWKFTHIFTDNGDDTKTLWLSRIDHEGRADFNGQGGESVPLPSVDLQGVHLRNRVDSDTDNTDAINRFRLATVLSETGAQLDITYAPAQCTATALPKPGESTKRCFPVVWAPPGTIEPRTDWFHKYVVAEVEETDRTGGGEDLLTRYDYQGDAGWRHAEPDGLADEKFLTWGQWQGYGKVSVTSGNRQTMRTRVDYTYLQGLNGDKLPGGGTRTEKVTDSTGTEYTGEKEFTGFEVESQAHDAGKVVAKSISEPWKHDTATQTRAWKTSKATVVKPEVSRGYTALADGTWRTTKSRSFFDVDHGAVRLQGTEDLGDVSKDDDNTCTRLWYADNPKLNILELPSRSETVSVNCLTVPDRRTQVIADERTAYDGAAFGEPPVKGDATTTERLTSHDGKTAAYQATGATSYDKFGRPVSQKDAVGAETTTAYTDVNGLISQTKVTNALGHVTTTDYAPAWGSSTGQTDPNGRRTDLAYDALGRLTSVWLADRRKTQSPSIKYAYNVRKDKAVVVKTEKIETTGGYGVEYQLYDSLLRARQKQTEGPNGSRMVADVFYDGAGKVKKTNATYNAANAPSDELLIVANGEVGGQTVTEYDGLGRTTASIFQMAGVEQWRTTTVHEGDRTHLDPPTGQMPTTSITDAAGRVTELRHYHSASPQPAGPGGQYDSTKYTYTPSGLMESVTDAKGNTWRYEYDQLGRKTKNIDPDSGTSTTVYDAVDRPVSATDGRGKTTSTAYDKLGRPVTTWEGAPDTGTRLTETRYDKAGWLGYAWASLRYTGATDYFASITQDMDALYRVKKTAYSVPASEGALAGTYTFTTAYNPDGTVSGQGVPAAGGLGGEAIAYGYDDLQRPISMTGKTSYVSDTQYTATSQLKALHLYTGSGKKIQQSLTYEKGTDRLTRSTVDIVGVTGAVKDSNYSYDQAGNVLAVSDTSGGSPDVQCFGYDAGQRLAEAWTPAATGAEAAGSGTAGSQLTAGTPSACAAAAGEKALGGPAPYWKSYETDAIGNRTKDVTHDVGRDASKDVTRTFTYGEGTAGPHAVTKVVDKTPTGDRQSTFAYDASGNTTTRTIGGNTQTLTWDASGDLAKTTEADGKATGYIYDASGDRVLRRDANATTVYLPGMELKLPKNSSTVEATRYYSYAGQTVAVRQNNNELTFLAADHHGTSELAINPTTGAVTQRRFDPYGGTRGEATGTWPGEKGFVGGTIDESTGLTHLGAREYDSSLGKFISVDPVIDYTSPQQINGYAYANNSPVTLSDPTGLAPCAPGVPDYGGSCGGKICYTCKTGETGETKKAQEDVKQAEQNLNDTKQHVRHVAKVLIKIVRDLIGVDAALDCLSSGDLGACGETLLNVAGSFAGGLAGKILAKYGAPWKWAKGIRLAKRVAGLVSDLIDGVKDVAKSSKALTKAKDALAAARAKAKAAIGKAEGQAPTACHSFLPGTQVLLANGSTKSIDKVSLGDKVVSTDPSTGETTVREIAGTIVTEDDKHFVEVIIKAAAGSSASVVATTTHPFWVKSKSTWVEAGDLKPGMTLREADGSAVTVESVRHFDKRQQTHDLTVKDVHSYYVLAGAISTLVHNNDSLTCDLRAYSDLSRLAPGKNEGAASALLTPSGNTYFDISTPRLGEARRGLILPLRRVLDQTGHHGGCAEIGCISQAMEAGDLVRGSSSLAMLRKPFEHPRYRDLVPACDSCQAVMSRLQITDMFQG